MTEAVLDTDAIERFASRVMWQKRLYLPIMAVGLSISVLGLAVGASWNWFPEHGLERIFWQVMIAVFPPILAHKGFYSYIHRLSRRQLLPRIATATGMRYSAEAEDAGRALQPCRRLRFCRRLR